MEKTSGKGRSKHLSRNLLRSALSSVRRAKRLHVLVKHFPDYMPAWRSYPPVHTALPAAALRSAVRALTHQHAASALDQAQLALKRLYPNRELLLVASGTTALQLALTATRDGVGRPCVALPAYCCPDLGSATIGAGFAAQLYDVDPLTLQPDYSSLVRALKAGATHVVAAHLFGRLVDVQAVSNIASEFGSVVIEDAAQHAGATLRGVRGGALAPLSVLSFGRGKGLNAGGGGALLWDSSVQGEYSFTLAPASPAGKQLLAAAAASVLSNPMLYSIPRNIPALALGETRYHAPQPPRAMHAATAALLVATLAAEPAALQERQRNEDWYERELSDHHALRVANLGGCVSGALRYPLRIKTGRADPLAPLGVARSYPRTLSDYPAINAVLSVKSPMPGATELAGTLHTLPTHGLLREHDRVRIVRSVTGENG